MRTGLLALGVMVVALGAACGSGNASSTDVSTGAGASPGAGSTSSGGGGGTIAVGASSGSGASDAGALVTYGQAYAGGIYNLGPVDYAETAFHNACAPSTKYPANVQQVEGTLLAGLWSGIPNVASYCDACIEVVTAKGKSAMLRVVTYGSTTTNSIDTSQSAYDLLNVGEDPRDMTWQFAKCPDTGPLQYEFQSESSQYYTSLWVRNARVPLAKVEVKSASHASYVELTRGTDGTLTDGGGFGVGTFSIRSTGVDGQQVVDTFAWPSNNTTGAFLTGTSNFQ